MQASDMTTEQLIRYFRCMGSANAVCREHQRCRDCPYYVPQSYNVRFRDAAMEIANRLEAALNRGGQATWATNPPAPTRSTPALR